MPCRVAILGQDMYGKFPRHSLESMIIMEYKHLYTLLARYLPPSALSSNSDFKAFLLEHGERLIYEYSDFMLMTLPNPRVLYY